MKNKIILLYVAMLLPFIGSAQDKIRFASARPTDTAVTNSGLRVSGNAIQFDAFADNDSNVVVGVMPNGRLVKRYKINTPAVDSSIYQTVFRVDTMRGNLYAFVETKLSTTTAASTYLKFTDTALMLGSYYDNRDTGRSPSQIVTGGGLAKVKDSLGTILDTKIDGAGVSGQLPYWFDANTLGSLSTVTYPSMTELSYVKGATTSIQTQIDTKAPISTTATLTEIQTITNKTLTAPKVDGMSAGNIDDSVLMWNPATHNVEYLHPKEIASMVVKVFYPNYDKVLKWWDGEVWRTLDSIHGFAPPPSTLLYSHSDWTSSVFANYTATSGAPSYVGSAPFRMLDVNATSATQSFYENSIGFMNLRAYTRSFKFSVQTANTGALITISPLSFVLLPGYTTIFYLEGAEKGKMRSYDPTGGGAWTSALSFNIDDTIQLIEQELFGTRFMKAVRINGAGFRVDSVSTTYEDQIWVNGGGTTFATQASTYKFDLQLSNARIYLMEDKVESRMTYNADVLVNGDSYTLGLYGSVGAAGQTYANSWMSQWRAANPLKTIEFYAGGGVTSAQYATGGALTTQGTFVTSQAPHKAVIMLGTNDQAQGISTSTYIANLQTLINAYKANGTDSIFVCRLPPNDLFDVTSYNTAQAGLTDVDVFIDTYTPFKDGVTTDLDPTYSATDNLPHLNKAGQDLMFSTISAAVNP